METAERFARLTHAICKTERHSARPLRYTPAFPQFSLHVLLDPRRIMRWVWVGRVALVSALLIAAVFVWKDADPNDTLVATLAFAATMIITSLSAMWADVYHRPIGTSFHIGQCAADLCLVTTAVHITGGWSSQFAALYVLVIAVSALVLPSRGGPIVALLSCILYVGDTLLLRQDALHVGLGVQSVVFLVVGLGAEAIASRLRAAGNNREELAVKLAKVQFEAADILRTIRSGIVTVDPQGRLLYANPAASDLLGMHLRGFTGKPVMSALREVSSELATLLDRTAHTGERITRAEGTIRREGSAAAIGVTTTAGDAMEGGHTATAIFQDISDSKRVQSLRVRAERLQAVAELSASLAHEIRNPLASIRSATEQLAQRARANGVADDEQTLHNLAVREADRLDRLLGEFLDFARARATRSQSIDMARVADAAARMVRSHPDCVSGVRLLVDAESVEDGGEALIVEGDEDLLHRACFNLMLNAVQAVSPNGTVRVSVSTYMGDAPGFEDGRRAVQVVVSDDGPGVPFELRDRLFEPFVTGRNGGSGLGLPVVHRAAESHEGLVLVDHLEPGTRFTLVLPVTHTSPTDVVPSESIYGDVRSTYHDADNTVGDHARSPEFSQFNFHTS